MTRLTDERLDEIVSMELPKGRAVLAIADLCDEIDALRAELAAERAETARLSASLLAYWGQYGCVSEDTSAWQAQLDEAERRGREAERQAVLEWLRDVGDQHMNGDMVPCDEFVGEAYHQAASEVERADHVRSPGTPAPGAAKEGA